MFMMNHHMVNTYSVQFHAFLTSDASRERATGISWIRGWVCLREFFLVPETEAHFSGP